jgi:hypothetical protein
MSKSSVSKNFHSSVSYQNYERPDNSVGTAIVYVLDGPGIAFRSEQDFLHPSIPALCSTQLTIQWVTYRGGIYDQQDATNSQYLLLEKFYMFRAIIAHHQELGTVCAACVTQV